MVINRDVTLSTGAGSGNIVVGSTLNSDATGYGLTLTSGDGDQIKIPQEGRNSLLVFIRGKVTPTVWCPICHYQYLEMVEAVKKYNIAEKYDMDICFVIPYLKDSLPGS